MKISIRTRCGRIGVLAGAVFLLVVSTSSVASASAIGQKQKPLSIANVTLIGSSSGSAAPAWIAQAQGFFKEQGLTVSYIPSASAATQLAILVTGQAQFSLDSPSTDVPGVIQGAPIRAIIQAVVDSPTEIVLAQTAATQFGVPTTGTGKAGATKQFAAFKGSHVVLAISTVSSGSYSLLALEARLNGLTFGVGCTTCDINVDAVGSTANETTAVESGKVQAAIGTPPTTVITSPACVTIALRLLSPVNDGTSNFVSTTTTMIQQHRDAVQAFTTAYVKAALWSKTHENQAEKDFGKAIANYGGITSPEEQDYLYSGYAPIMTSPFPTKKSYNIAVEEINATLSTPELLPYTSYVDPTFVANAGKILGIKAT